MHDAKVREVMLDRYVTRSAAELGIGQPDNGRSMPSLLLNQPKLPLVFSRRKERRNAPVAKSSAVRSMSALLSNAERPEQASRLIWKQLASIRSKPTWLT